MCVHFIVVAIAASDINQIKLIIKFDLIDIRGCYGHRPLMEETTAGGLGTEPPVGIRDKAPDEGVVEALSIISTCFVIPEQII